MNFMPSLFKIKNGSDEVYMSDLLLNINNN